MRQDLYRSSPPIVAIIARIEGSANASIRSSARACGFRANHAASFKCVRSFHRRDVKFVLELSPASVITHRIGSCTSMQLDRSTSTATKIQTSYSRQLEYGFSVHGVAQCSQGSVGALLGLAHNPPKLLQVNFCGTASPRPSSFGGRAISFYSRRWGGLPA